MSTRYTALINKKLNEGEWSLTFREEMEILKFSSYRVVTQYDLNNDIIKLEMWKNTVTDEDGNDINLNDIHCKNAEYYKLRQAHIHGELPHDELFLKFNALFKEGCVLAEIYIGFYLLCGLGCKQDIPKGLQILVRLSDEGCKESEQDIIRFHNNVSKYIIQQEERIQNLQKINNYSLGETLSFMTKKYI